MAEFAHIKKQFWGRHMCARGYFCCSSGNVRDEVIAKYIAEQNIDQDEDFRLDGCIHLLLEARWCGNHLAGLWPETGLTAR